jgi:hypothetical protein
MALVDSAIRSSKQLASSGDVMARSLGNRIFSDLTQLRRQMPHRRLNETPGEAMQGAPATNAAVAKVIARQPSPSEHAATSSLAPVAATKTAAAAHCFDEHTAIRDAIDSDATQFQALIDLHCSRTMTRLKAHAMALCLYGECEFELGSVRSTTLNDTPTSTRIAVKTVFASSPQQEPLGLLDAWLDAQTTPDTDDVTGNAMRAYAQVAETRKISPSTRLLFIAELHFALARFAESVQKLGSPADWLLQVPVDSALFDDAAVWGRVVAGAELGDKTIALASDNVDTPQEIRLRLWTQRIEVQIDGDKVWATCLVARAVDQNPEASTLEWRLLTNRNAPDLASASELFEYWLTFDLLNRYTQSAQLAIRNDFAPVCGAVPLSANLSANLSVSMHINLASNLTTACRIAQLLWHLQATPEIDAGVFFTDQEIHGLELLTPEQSAAAPQLAQIMGSIARLGGGGKTADPSAPNFEAIQRGLQRLSDAVAVLRRLAPI